MNATLQCSTHHLSGCETFLHKDITVYLAHGENEKAFNLLVRFVEFMSEMECDMSEEDIFRSTELLSYYFAKIITLSSGSLKNRMHNWMYRFTKENEEYSLIADNNFRVFLEGKLIYHTDEYFATMMTTKKYCYTISNNREKKICTDGRMIIVLRNLTMH